MQNKSSLQSKIEALRVEHKKLKSEVATKKLLSNGTFGKLGSPYSAFYSPDLMLAVTLTGQLNLAQLIFDIEYRPDIKVLSANTDGIMVQYPASQRDRVLKVISENAVRTGFEYEESAYKTVALANVNNYVAITEDRDVAIIKPDGSFELSRSKGGKLKRKGLFAEKSLMKNPTNEVCSLAACEYLRSGKDIREFVYEHSVIEDFLSIRNVKGGGIQYDRMEEVDDWELIEDLGTKDNLWSSKTIGKQVRRKSRPAPVEVGVGGTAFGRIARWAMEKGGTMPINYIGSGNRVPKTNGAKLVMTLPDSFPDWIDVDWYIQQSLSILADIGVNPETQGEEQ